MNIPVRKDDFAKQLSDALTELGGEGFGPLLKFDGTKKKYFIGTDEILPGGEYIAHVPECARGWVKFVDKTPVDRRIVKITDGRPPERGSLDEVEKAGEKDDPWVFQYYLPLENRETGETVVFITKSAGGRIALGNLLRSYERNWDRGLPIIQLAFGTFKTKEYEIKDRPDFVIIGWEPQTINTRPEITGPSDIGADDPGNKWWEER